jgi:hypothetical protein
MKALISPIEKIYTYDGTLLGERVAEVTATSFDVCEPFFWVDCDDSVVADRFYYSNNQFLEVPLPPPLANTPTPVAGNGPVVI